MAKRVQIFRGAASVVNATVLKVGEMMANLTAKSLHLGDGVTPGGTELARADLANVATATSNNAGKMSAAQAAQLTNASITLPGIVPGVLSLSSSDLETDVAVATTTMYWHPRYGNTIALYDTGDSAWELVTATASISGSFAAIASNKVFDVFMYNNAGTPALEFVAWTSNTVRATNLTTQDGIRVKSGDASRRYLGTAYRNASGCLDDETHRWLWNYYNRIEKSMYAIISDGNPTHDYSTNTWRTFGGVTTPQFSYVKGLNGQLFQFDADAVAFTDNATPVRAGLAFARMGDLTTVPTGSNRLSSGVFHQQGNNQYGARPGAFARSGSTQGLESMWVLQIGNSSGGSTMTWYCDDGSSSGIVSSARGKFFG